MRLLVDGDINEALREASPLATGISRPLDDGLTRGSQVQAASLSLTIGDIFVPGTRPDDLGGCNRARKIHCLEQGHTAVIRTRETVHLTSQQAGIGFPHATESLNGLLMTNPGHVDPGYSGPLHCTIINMGHLPYTLKEGDRIMRLLIFQFDTNHVPQAPFNVRHQLASRAVGRSPITADLLDRLSVDFVDVEKRAGHAAEMQINKAQIAASRIPIIVVLVSGVLAFATSYLTSTLSGKEDFNKLREEFIQAKASLDNKDAIYKLQTDLAQLRDETRRPQGPALPSSNQNRNP